jgi:hypothetical protein
MLRVTPSALPLLLAALMGCGLSGCAPLNEAAGTLAGIDTIVMVPVFGRDTVDMAYSAISGRDCSIVRLEQGKGYCVPLEGPVPPDEFCTHSLGVVDCWAYPGTLPGQPVPVGDKPILTPQQEVNREERWPKL